MGNSIGKDKGEETVDGGQLMPHGVYKGPQDWDYRSVRKLIIERKLAPFYKGLSDYDESWNEVTTASNLPKNGTTKGKEVPPSKSVEAQLYKGAIECPICFLYYPRNINHSRCCDQPICTECFVQIKRPENGTLGANNSPAVCPFCVEPNFGVCYKPPTFSAGIGSESSPSTTSLNTNNLIPPSSSTTSLNPQDGKPRRKSVSHKNPDVVTTDQIRPDWAARVLQQPPRQLPTPRRPTNTSPSRRIMVRPGGGGSTYVTSSTNSSRRNNQPTGGEYGGYLAAMRMGTDLEELMVMEAIRLSLLEQEERERREREERDQTERTQDDNSNNASSSDGSTTETITTPNLSNNDENGEGELLNRIDNNFVNIDDEILTSRRELLENDDDDDESSSISHSHDQTPTTVSTPITASTEDGTITSTSAPSSRGSGPSTPSSTNSTNEALSPPSSPLTHNHNITSSTEISTSARGSNDDSLLLNEIDDHGQTSEQVNDIKKPTVSILSNNALGVDDALVKNESDGDTRDPRGGSWGPA